MNSCRTFTWNPSSCDAFSVNPFLCIDPLLYMVLLLYVDLNFHVDILPHMDHSSPTWTPSSYQPFPPYGPSSLYGSPSGSPTYMNFLYMSTFICMGTHYQDPLYYLYEFLFCMTSLYGPLFINIGPYIPSSTLPSS